MTIDIESIATAPIRAVYTPPAFKDFIDAKLTHHTKKAIALDRDIQEASPSSEAWYMPDPRPHEVSAAHYQEVKELGARSACFPWVQDNYIAHVNTMVGGMTAAFWTLLGTGAGVLAAYAAQKHNIPLPATLAMASPALLACFVGAWSGVDVMNSEKLVKS